MPLNGRARGDQVRRINPPRPPKNDRDTRTKILHLIKKSVKEASPSRAGSALHLLLNAQGLEKGLTVRDTDLARDIETRVSAVKERLALTERKRSTRTEVPFVGTTSFA